MFQRFKQAKYTLLLAIASFILIIILQLPSLSAERIDFNYSLLGFDIKVKDLENFAKQGEISRSLNFYLKRISPEKREELQEFLGQSYDVDPVLVYRYSRTSVGKRLLARIGEIIQIRHNLNGFYGLRSAVVQTAASPDGVNFVNFLKTFPTDIKLNLPELLKLVKHISRTEEDTKNFIASLKLSNKNNKSKSSLSDFQDLSKKGEFNIIKQTKEFYDQKRQRNLITDLYFPQGITEKIPVIVVSNGIGAKRDRFDELANHLASYGFAVVIPDHPGSDRQRQKDFLKGLYKENFDATDFIDRPLDISFILDELEEINQNQLQNSLNLEQVGIFGYSIGSTTVMSLAGAEINFRQLQQNCAQQLNLVNISSLYQCRALELPRVKRPLKDKRIKAAFMFVPFGYSLFNQQELSKISIPTMWQVVDRDFLTSLLEEQVPMFNSLKNSDRYLVISEKLPHSNVTLSKNQQSSQVNIFQIAKNYQNILSLVFFQNYITQNPEYRAYLSQEYLQAIAQEPYNLHLLNKSANKEK
jgi:predicted dienelactone hydrolase